MSDIANISLSLDFNQVVDIVKQLPEEKQKQLIELIESTPHKKQTKRLSTKEKGFLKSLDKSVDFVNNYNQRKTKTKSFKQMLNEL
jgi:hypothetical protein